MRPPRRGRFRVQGHFSHQGVGITIRVLRNGSIPFGTSGSPGEMWSSLSAKRLPRSRALASWSGPTGSGKRRPWPRSLIGSGAIIPSTSSPSRIRSSIVYRGYHRSLRWTSAGACPGNPARNPSTMCAARTRAGRCTAEETRHHSGRRNSHRRNPADRAGSRRDRTFHSFDAAYARRRQTLGRMRQMFSLEQARGSFSSSPMLVFHLIARLDAGRDREVHALLRIFRDPGDRRSQRDPQIRRRRVPGCRRTAEQAANRKWNSELKALLNAKRITPEVYEQFYQVTGLENK